MWQEDVASGAVGLTRVLYGFNGASVAQRTHITSPSSDSVIYLHGDHLGSVSVVSGWSGSATTLVSSQRFDPWGKVLAGGNVTQTRTNYTGQELDTTGLLYYHARFYDPNLGRFLSADTVVPGSASGSMNGVALKPLTVDFHEPGFVAGLNGENGQAFWFQMSDKERQHAGSPWGPGNPQALNRYSYVQNNPLRYVDPSGHTWYLTAGQAGQLTNALHELAAIVKDTVTLTGFGSAITGAVASLIGKYALSEVAAEALAAVAGAVVAVAALGSLVGAALIYYAGMQIDQLAYQIQDFTDPEFGVALAYNQGQLFMLNRKTGATGAWNVPLWMAWQLPDSLAYGTIVGDPVARDQKGNTSGHVFPRDCRIIASSRKDVKCI
jgi:RHS repeat-associated protein